MRLPLTAVVLALIRLTAKLIRHDNFCSCPCRFPGQQKSEFSAPFFGNCNATPTVFSNPSLDMSTSRQLQLISIKIITLDLIFVSIIFQINYDMISIVEFY